jgi:large subunit ribosomal protein L10
MPRVLSGHVLSETAGARDLLRREPLNSLPPPGGVKGGQHRRGRPGFCRTAFGRRLGGFGSNHLSGGGLFARLRGQAQVVAAHLVERRGAACAVGGNFPPTGDSTVDRAEKNEAVATLHEVFSKTSVVVVAHYSGLTVAQMQTLRKQMKLAGARVQVAKNRLAKIALEGTDVASVGSLLKGPALIAYSDDPVAAPKVAVAFAKDYEKFVLLGGAMGKTALTVDGVKSLATLPSLDELRAKLLGLLQAPATKLAQLSTAPAAKLARVFGAYASKDAA